MGGEAAWQGGNHEVLMIMYRWGEWTEVECNRQDFLFGHPLQLKRRGRAARFGVVSMCIGSGMGAAAVFERGGEVDEVMTARPAPGPQNNLSRDAVVA